MSETKESYLPLIQTYTDKNDHYMRINQKVWLRYLDRQDVGVKHNIPPQDFLRITEGKEVKTWDGY